MRQIPIIVEKASDGYFWCRTAEEINGNTMLSGCGATVADAKKDLLDCYNEAKADAKESGESFEDVEFTYSFDLVSFFNYFSFLNVTDIAKRAGINPSLMRQYTSGLKNAGEKTYNRLAECIGNITKELTAASF